MTYFFDLWRNTAEQFYSQRIKGYLQPDFPLGWFFLYAAVAFFFTFSSLNLTGDDIYNKNVECIFSKIKYQYAYWSSRTLIDFFTTLFCKYAMGVFAVLNVVILCSIPLTIGAIFKNTFSSRIYGGTVFLLCLTYNLKATLNTGIVATSLNYSWPLACMLMVMTICLRISKGKRISKAGMIGLFPLAMFASNQEQLCLVGLAALLAINGKVYLREKKVYPAVCGVLVIYLLSLASILLCPGNSVRYHGEVQNWYPEFYSFSFLYKLYLGFISTSHHYFFDLNLPYLAFGLLLGAVVYNKYKPIPKDWQVVFLFSPALLPLSISLTQFYLGIPNISPYLFDADACPYLLHAGNFTSAKLYLFLFVSVVTAFSILYLVVLAFKDTGYVWYVLFVLGLGFCSRMIMGFSPTLFASSVRTFIIMDFSFIIVAVALIDLSPKLSPKKLMCILLPCALLQIVGLFVQP